MESRYVELGIVFYELGFLIVETNGVYSIVPKPPKNFINKLIGLR
jgi:hypothetical protein